MIANKRSCRVALGTERLSIQSNMLSPDVVGWLADQLGFRSMSPNLMGWFADRFGCSTSEDQDAVDQLMLSAPEGFAITWVRADTVSSNLQQMLNMSKIELERVVLACPAVLGYTLDNALNVQLAALQDLLCLSQTDLRKVVLAHPSVLAYSIEYEVKPMLETLQSMLNISTAEIRTLVLAYPSVLKCSALGDHTQTYLKSVLAPLQMLLTGNLDKSESFHKINLGYPGVELLHENPNVYIIRDFLTSDECDHLIAKAKPNLTPCLVGYDEDAEEVEEAVDWSRTSLVAYLRRLEAPTIVAKLVALANCEEAQLEIMSILFYVHGQKFSPHRDGFNGPTTACGFVDSGRLATIFCYLNDVDSGGKTRFNQIELDITPKKGMAVVHFPACTELVEDLRTEHEGLPAVDQKWLLATWVWKHCRCDEHYECMFPLLSNDTI